jgi:hypothetical protein
MRLGWCGALAVAAMLACGMAAAQSRLQPGNPPLNPTNDDLVKLAPSERAARFAQAVGNWCIGTETFLMGVLTSDPGAGNAYWSLRCADGGTWAVQVDKYGAVTAIDCASYNTVAVGKECFKKF